MNDGAQLSLFSFEIGVVARSTFAVVFPAPAIAPEPAYDCNDGEVFGDELYEPDFID